MGSLHSDSSTPSSTRTVLHSTMSPPERTTLDSAMVSQLSRAGMLPLASELLITPSSLRPSMRSHKLGFFLKAVKGHRRKLSSPSSRQNIKLSKAKLSCHFLKEAL